MDVCRTFAEERQPVFLTMYVKQFTDSTVGLRIQNICITLYIDSSDHRALTQTR